MDVRLDSDRYAAARRFLVGEARPVDFAWAANRLDGAPSTLVEEALDAYRLPGGGFGRALEPDVRLPAASVIATTVGIQYMESAGVPPDSPLLQEGVRWLESAFDPEAGGWPSVPAAVDGYPRAPWWDHALHRRDEPAFRANPDAEVLGYLIRYRGSLAGDGFDYLVEPAIDHLSSITWRAEMHDALCWLRLAGALGGDQGNRIRRAFSMTGVLDLATKPSEWAAYRPGPLWYAPEPGMWLADFLADRIASHLDHTIAMQGDDGAWWPTWEWGRMPSDWALAAKEWAGHLTAKALITLSAWGRL